MNTRSPLIEYIINNYYEGNRYNFLTRLAGSFASLGINKDILIDIYRKYLRRLDDENRERIIHRTYERYNNNEGIIRLPYNDYLMIVKYLGIDNISTNTKLSTITGNNKQYYTLDRSKLVPLDKNKHRLYYKYLVYNVNIPESSIDKWDFYVLSYQSRLCVVDNNIVIGRSIFNIPPKYMIWGDKSKCLWNYNPTKLHRVIVEGVFDAISVESRIPNINAVALLGKTINKYKISLLRNSAEVSIMLDGDVSDNEIKFIANILAKYTTVYICKLAPDMDPVDYGDEIIEVFASREVYG